MLLPVTVWFSLNHKRRSHEQSQKKKDSDSFVLMTLLTPRTAYYPDPDSVASENYIALTLTKGKQIILILGKVFMTSP